jgi:hypothetical protein
MHPVGLPSPAGWLVGLDRPGALGAGTARGVREMTGVFLGGQFVGREVAVLEVKSTKRSERLRSE